MALTQRVITDIRNASGESIATDDSSASGTVEQEFSISVAGVGDATVAISVAFASIKAFAIISSRDVTLETNDPADQTFALEAGKAFFWHDGLLLPNPLTDNITSLVFTNAGAAAATIRGVFLT